jgi:cytochrome c oxidase assembly protein subunit 15
MGALPPMNEQDWNTAFEKYKQIAQYKYVNAYFNLADFKSIFFWEWFHRLWARLIAVAFVIPFIIFIVQKRFKREMIKPMVILFLLGALQGLVGWIMVQSGLEESERTYVSHYRLAIHFVLALGLICYTLWFALGLLVPKEQITINKRLRNFTVWLIALLVIQLIYGAFMAGLKAGPAAATWPSINGAWLPEHVHSHIGRNYPGLSFLFDNPLVVHFIHRSLAYIITILIIMWWWKANKSTGTKLFTKTKGLPLLIVLVQVVLGILSVLNSTVPGRFIWLAEIHQLTAMLLLLSLVWILYLVRSKSSNSSAA